MYSRELLIKIGKELWDGAHYYLGAHEGTKYQRFEGYGGWDELFIALAKQALWGRKGCRIGNIGTHEFAALGSNEQLVVYDYKMDGISEASGKFHYHYRADVWKREVPKKEKFWESDRWTPWEQVQILGRKIDNEIKRLSDKLDFEHRILDERTRKNQSRIDRAFKIFALQSEFRGEIERLEEQIRRKKDKKW